MPVTLSPQRLHELAALSCAPPSRPLPLKLQCLPVNHGGVVYSGTAAGGRANKGKVRR